MRNLYQPLIRFISLIVPQRLRADWRQEWEAELQYREEMLAEWDRLTWRNKLDLLGRSTSAFWDALVLLGVALLVRRAAMVDPLVALRGEGV